MYITITAQKTNGNYSQSSADFVAYLEKENQQLKPSELEYFFNQHGEQISAEEVVDAIDKNTAKLKKREPKFYSITINPSTRELKHLQHNKETLKRYTREIMKDYAASFNREVNGRKVTVNDILYFAKIEHQRTFKGTDKQVRENQPYANQILELRHQIRRIAKGEEHGNIQKLQRKIQQLEREAPHQQNGKRIVQGMQKEGNQSHIHIIVSRKDISNSVGLSPGSKYKASEVLMNGKKVKRGFDRDSFFKKAEKTFDKTFGYKRNYAESYASRKDFLKDPKLYFKVLLGLPANEKTIAFKILGKSGVPMLDIPTNKVQVAIRTIKQLKRGVDIALKSGSIGI